MSSKYAAFSTVVFFAITYRLLRSIDLCLDNITTKQPFTLCRFDVTNFGIHSGLFLIFQMLSHAQRYIILNYLKKKLDLSQSDLRISHTKIITTACNMIIDGMLSIHAKNEITIMKYAILFFKRMYISFCSW